jgi:hypothetical protein
MARQKGKHVSDKAQYKSYVNNGRHQDNKIAKIERTLKKQPNNEALREVLKKLLKVGVVYKRSRRSLLRGSKVNTHPKLHLNPVTNRERAKKQRQSVAPWVELLAVFKETLKPTVRKRRGKRSRVS